MVPKSAWVGLVHTTISDGLSYLPLALLLTPFQLPSINLPNAPQSFGAQTSELATSASF
jgi:hypothetical protein